MTRTPAGIKRAELVELLEVDEQIKQLTMRKLILRDKALRAHGDFLGTAVYGPVVCTLSEARTFDPDSFASQHPAEQHPAFYRATVDRDAVPKELRDAHSVPVRRLSVRRAA